MAVMAQRAVSASIVIGLFGYTAMTMWDVYQLNGEVTDLDQQRSGKSSSLEDIKRHSKLPVDQLERVDAMLDLNDALYKTRYSPEWLLNTTSKMLQGKVRASIIQWEIKELPPGVAPLPVSRPAGDAGAASTKQKSTAPPASLTFTFDFDPADAKDHSKLKDLTTEILNTLRGALTGCDVNYTSLPAFLTDKERIDETLSQNVSDAPTTVQAKLMASCPADIGDIADATQPAKAEAQSTGTPAQ
jgi:hypothetical protein